MNLRTTAAEITRTGYSIKKSSNRSIVVCVLRDACHKLICVFGNFMHQGRRYPGYQRFFLACDEELRRSQADTSSAFGTGHF